MGQRRSREAEAEAVQLEGPRRDLKRKNETEKERCTEGRRGTGDMIGSWPL